MADPRSKTPARSAAFEAVFALSNQVENELNEIRELSNLAEWIERARRFVANVQATAEWDEVFMARLKSKVPAWGLSWEHEASEGLARLQLMITGTAADVLTSVDDAVELAHKSAPR